MENDGEGSKFKVQGSSALVAGRSAGRLKSRLNGLRAEGEGRWTEVPAGGSLRLAAKSACADWDLGAGQEPFGR